ncbi:hypothetical protein BGZ83_009517 [Gryganskiella cystojenkinii]|nr:hypothetical protein BGZ83_009517 [Gryganskiella cystojenkinii]
MIAIRAAFTFVVLAIVSSTASATIYPIWCKCESSALTAHPCSVAGGNYDGGSCGMTSYTKCNNFRNACKSEQGQGINCWDQYNNAASC